MRRCNWRMHGLQVVDAQDFAHPWHRTGACLKVAIPEDSTIRNCVLSTHSARYGSGALKTKEPQEVKPKLPSWFRREGCTLASSIASCLARGMEMPMAVQVQGLRVIPGHPHSKHMLSAFGLLKPAGSM